MRIFTAALGLEANTFLPLPTSYEAFVEKLYLPPARQQARPSHQTAACWVAADRAKR
jgi:microcystin degradation protein MlrC